MDIGKEGLEAIDTLKMEKQLMLSSAMPLQHLQDRRLEIVIDGHAGHASPKLESMTLPQQEGVLPLGGEALHIHSSTKAEAASQEGNLQQLVFDCDHRLAKVKLCPLAWSKVERDECRFRGLSLLLHIHTYRRFPNRDPQLTQFHPHPMSRPALFGSPTL